MYLVPAEEGGDAVVHGGFFCQFQRPLSIQIMKHPVRRLRNGIIEKEMSLCLNILECIY